MVSPYKYYFYKNLFSITVILYTLLYKLQYVIIIIT